MRKYPELSHITPRSKPCLCTFREHYSRAKNTVSRRRNFGSETDAKPRAKRGVGDDIKRERKAGGRERAKTGLKKGAKGAVKRRRKHPRKNSRRPFSDASGSGEETARSAKFPKSLRKEKREIKKGIKQETNSRKSLSFGTGEKCQKIAAVKTEKTKNAKLSTILYNEFCNTLDGKGGGRFKKAWQRYPRRKEEGVFRRKKSNPFPRRGKICLFYKSFTLPLLQKSEIVI